MKCDRFDCKNVAVGNVKSIILMYDKSPFNEGLNYCEEHIKIFELDKDEFITKRFEEKDV